MANAAPKQIQNIVIEVTPQTPPPVKQGDETPIPCSLREIGNSPHGRLDSGKIQLDPGEGPFCVILRLNGQLGWRDGDPLWIREGECPESMQIASQQIWLDRRPDGKSITLLNMNVGNPCDLHYRMNFTDGYYCDPIMSNGGGNIVSSN